MQRERERVPQFVIEVECLLAYWHFHPTRVGILFVLIAHFPGDTARNRGQALDTCAQRLLFERFSNLLAQYLINCARLFCSEKPACIAQGVERKICSYGQQEKWRYDCVSVQQRL